jgi:imidazolonepropionase-like amidohydrolase
MMHRAATRAACACGRHAFVGLALAACARGGMRAGRLADEANKGAVTAFIDVAVIPMDRERVLEHQTVVVRGGQVASVSAVRAGSLPSGAVRIDGRGKFLMPGLAEMHGHIPAQAGPFAESVMLLFVANGVTTVRGMLGNPTQFELRRAIARGDMIGPALLLASPPLSGNQVRTGAEGAAKVREYKGAGYDLLKIHEGLSRETYDSVVAAARVAGIRFGGHVPDDVGVWHALESGQSTIDHLDNYTDALRAADFPGVMKSSSTGGTRPSEAELEQRIVALAMATRRAEVAVVPTMALWEAFSAPEDSATLAMRPELHYAPAATRARWFRTIADLRSKMDPAQGAAEVALRRRMLKGLQDAGVPILLGTDAPQLFSVPGFSIHREMQVMRAAGLTPFQILRSGTKSVAEHFDQFYDDHVQQFYGWPAPTFGTVEVGRRADLILLDANPLDDIANLQRRAGVMLRGRWLPEAELRARLETLAAVNR